ncbi:MAG: Ig-like domain-containing protein, partial [Chlorobi bacterium]|nr:Ig-like domain-containing protein [Chlorobiota bacterium]
MKTTFSHIRVLAASIIGIAIFYSCANQIAPSGGEVDKIPPEIIETYPLDGTTNFNDDYIEVTFSEYVQKPSVQSAIFISPEIDGEIDYDWSGKSLSIEFSDSLKSNTTYLVSFGTEISDLNNGNKMTRAFNLTFSTGDKIDHGIVEGRVFTDEEPSKVNIYAYRLDTLDVNPLLTKPDYISQVNLDGEYKLLALPNASFRIFAVRDEFKDRLYNIGEDEYGAPFGDIAITATDSIFRGLNYFLTKEDTIKPGVTNLVMTDMNHIMLEFSEEIDLGKISAENFTIMDSSENKMISVKYEYVGSGNEKKIFLSFADSLSEENENYLLSKGIFDKFGNEANPDTSFISVNTAPDTVSAKLIKTTANYGADKLDYIGGFIELTFDDGFDILSAAKEFLFYDS